MNANTSTYPQYVPNQAHHYYEQEIRKTGHPTFKIPHQVFELAKDTNLQKLKKILETPGYPAHFQNECAKERNLKADDALETMLEYQFQNDVKGLQSSQSLQLVDMAIQSGFTWIKIPTRTNDIKQFKSTVDMAIPRIEEHGLKPFIHIDLGDSTKLFQAKLEHALETSATGISFKYRSPTTHKLNYQRVTMLETTKILQLSGTQRRHKRLDPHTCMPLLLGLVFDTVTLYSHRPYLGLPDVPIENADIFSEAHGGYYTLPEWIQKLGNEEFITNTNHPLLTEPGYEVAELLQNEHECNRLNATLKSHETLALQQEFQNIASAKRKNKLDEYVSEKPLLATAFPYLNPV
ncbi:hypothetical protein HY572_01245 [Candidatus Micrarchaeota archaeon]|nr:hypothetical protein [Candidatus Micrarchaeota archaeon]